MRVLDGIRVVNLGEGAEVGLAAMILADFGADVIIVERPGGDPWRAHPASRMTMRGQKSVVWDPHDAADTARLREVVGDADVVLSSRAPELLASAGLDCATLAARRPELVFCDVSAFGREGKLANAPLDADLAAARTGRMLAFRGLVAREGPVYAALPVATHASAQALAAAALAGIARRERSGHGSSFATSLARGLLPYEMGGLFALQLAERGGAPLPPFDPMTAMPTINYHAVQCGDGRWLQLGNLLPHLLARFLELTGLAADVPETLRGKPALEWPADQLEDFRARMITRMQERSADEWMRIFVADGGVVAHPYQTTQQALDDPDLVANGHVVAHGDVRQLGLRQLGVVAKLERTPGRASFDVPDVGSSAVDSIHWPLRGTRSAAQPSAAPLDGVTVVEFATIIAAPLGVATLADLGARVIKVEPIDGDPFRGMLNGLGAARVNLGKESIALDLKAKDGQRIARELIARADVLIHNYRPGVPERLGIGYEDARASNPKLVYVSVNGYGRAGPGALRPSTHPIPGAALGGVVWQMGGALPREVRDVASVRETARKLSRAQELNPDPNTSMVVATAALLGLVARLRHDVGQEVQVDMFGANAYANFDDFVDFPGKAARRLPDRDLLGLGGLHRLYRCRAGWIFLSAESADSRARLRDALDRLGYRGIDDASLARVFAERDAVWWEDELAPQGIGCVVADPAASAAAWLLSDPFARQSGLVGEAQHREWGAHLRPGRVVDYDGAPMLRGACVLGEHTRALLDELGYGASEIDRLIAAGLVAATA